MPIITMTSFTIFILLKFNQIEANQISNTGIIKEQSDDMPSLGIILKENIFLIVIETEETIVEKTGNQTKTEEKRSVWEGVSNFSGLYKLKEQQYISLICGNKLMSIFTDDWVIVKSIDTHFQPLTQCVMTEAQENKFLIAYINQNNISFHFLEYKKDKNKISEKLFLSQSKGNLKKKSN